MLDYKNDTHGYVRENNVKASEEVLGMIQNLDLIDTWRAQNLEAKTFTWVSGKKRLKWPDWISFWYLLTFMPKW